MAKHVCVETNFLIDLRPMPHRLNRGSRSAADLWNAFECEEIELHIPYLCLQEALNNQQQKTKLSLTEIKEVRKYLSSRIDSDWDKEHVIRFFACVDDYLREEQTSGVRNRLLGVWNEIEKRKGVIYPEKEVFDLMPLGVEHLQPNDHLILASVLHRARVLRQESAQNMVYFCSKDGHMSPVVTKDERPKFVEYRPVLGMLYQDNGIEFLADFALPVDNP